MFKSLVASVPVALACLAGVAGAGAAVPRDGSARIKVRITAGRYVIVPVMVNGTGPHRFLLDTGATSTMIVPALAARLRLPAAGSAVEQTATQAETANLVRASLSLGGVSGDDVEIIATPLDAVQAVDPAITGVLGQDLLRQANWWLDYERGVLVADAEGRYAARDLGPPVPVHWQADRPAVDGLLPDRRSLRFVLDSAASAALLFREVPGAPVSAEGRVRLRTHSGEATAPSLIIGPMRVGPVVLPPFAAGMVASPSSERPEDGLLPTALFDSIYFDNRSGAVVFNPRRSALSRRAE
jgi:aspartyl protease